LLLIFFSKIANLFAIDTITVIVATLTGFRDKSRPRVGLRLNILLIMVDQVQTPHEGNRYDEDAVTEKRS